MGTARPRDLLIGKSHADPGQKNKKESTSNKHFGYERKGVLACVGVCRPLRIGRFVPRRPAIVWDKNTAVSMDE